MIRHALHVLLLHASLWTLMLGRELYRRDLPLYHSGTKYAYDSDEALTSLWLSAAAYCSQESLLTRSFQGPTHGFVVTDRINHADTGTVGFVGFMNRLRRIYVVFRGTHSVGDVNVDLQMEQVPYSSYPDCTACTVHKGFLAAEQAVIEDVMAAVWRLVNRTRYGLSITGHSLGGALAHLTALDFIREGIIPSVYTFGQPRVGNVEFANLLSSLPAVRGAFTGDASVLWRVTHYQDIVPHLPLADGYYHACREAYEGRDSTQGVRMCSASDCQDDSCSMQWFLFETGWSDHSVYLGLPISCTAVSQ